MDGISFTLQRGSPFLFALLVSLALVATIWAYRATLPPIPRRARRVLGVLRFSSLSILLLVLFDPLVAIETVERIRPNVVLLVDRSASMGIADRPAAGGEAVARSAVVDDLLGEGGGLRKKLARRYDVAEFDFAEGLIEAKGSEGGDGTNIAGALEEAVEREWERGVDAFVLLSDGIANSGRDPVRVAGELGIPLFPAGIGDPATPRDLALEQVLANPLVYVNSRVSVEVTIRAKGFTGEEVSVRIREGEKVLAGEVVRFDTGREARTLSLAFPVQSEGVHRYTVEVPVEEGELVAENNRILFTVEAVKERLEVLLLAERPGWDLAFLKRSLDRDPNVNARCFLQSKDGGAEPIPGAGAPSPFPYGDEELRSADLVILLGLPGPVRRAWGEVLDRYVRRRGGALLVLFSDPLPGPLPERLADLLPAVVPKRKPVFDREPFVFRPTGRGENHPMLRFQREGAGGSDEWADLPPLLGAHRIGPVRPGALLLAAHPTATVDGREVPVLALGTAGKGRVLLLNGAGSWRWDFRMWGLGRSNRLYERFWANAVRWLVARGGFRNVSVKTEKMTYNRGEAVSFRSLILDGSLSPVADAIVEVVLRPAEGPQERFRLDADPAETGAYRKSVGPFPPGDYAYEATVVRGGVPLGEDRGEFSVGEFSTEFLETERNDALLGALARAGGGRVLDAAELGGWDGDLSLQSRVRRVRAEKEIWNHYILFLLLLLLLSAEWYLRKRQGLS